MEAILSHFHLSCFFRASFVLRDFLRLFPKASSELLGTLPSPAGVAHARSFPALISASGVSAGVSL